VIVLATFVDVASGITPGYPRMVKNATPTYFICAPKSCIDIKESSHLLKGLHKRNRNRRNIGEAEAPMSFSLGSGTTKDTYMYIDIFYKCRAINNCSCDRRGY